MIIIFFIVLFHFHRWGIRRYGTRFLNRWTNTRGSTWYVRRFRRRGK